MTRQKVMTILISAAFAVWAMPLLAYATIGDESLGAESKEEIQLELSQDDLADYQVRELKASDYELGKSMIDAFGKRVRMEEYLFKPEPNQYKFLVLNFRENRLDYYYDLWKFKNNLAEDFNVRKFLWDCGEIFFNRDEPTNWLTEWETLMSNTKDNFQWWTGFGDPISVTRPEYKYDDTTNSWGPTGNNVIYWIPRSVTDKTRIFASDGSYDKVKEYWYSSTTGGNKPTWTWELRYPGTGLSGKPIYKENDLTAAFGGTYNENTSVYTALPGTNPDVIPSYEWGGPRGPEELVMPPPDTPLYFWDKTIYKDNTWIQFDFHVIKDDGKHYTIGEAASFFGEQGEENLDDISNVNFEIVIQAPEFEGRKIDVVIDPSIFFTNEESEKASKTYDDKKPS